MGLAAGRGTVGPIGAFLLQRFLLVRCRCFLFCTIPKPSSAWLFVTSGRGSEGTVGVPATLLSLTRCGFAAEAAVTCSQDGLPQAQQSGVLATKLRAPQKRLDSGNFVHHIQLLLQERQQFICHKSLIHGGILLCK